MNQLKRDEAASDQQTAPPQSPKIIPELLTKIHDQFIARLADHQQKDLNGRLDRALDIALAGEVEALPEPGQYLVKGHVGPKAAYHVDLQKHTCECPDHRGGNACKHRAAAWFIQETNCHTAPPDPAVIELSAIRHRYGIEIIIYAQVEIDGQTIAVEVQACEPTTQTATVQALPIMIDGSLEPIFPFETEFSDTGVMMSTTSVNYSDVLRPRSYSFEETTS